MQLPQLKVLFPSSILSMGKLENSYTSFKAQIEYSLLSVAFPVHCPQAVTTSFLYAPPAFPIDFNYLGL